MQIRKRKAHFVSLGNYMIGAELDLRPGYAGFAAFILLRAGRRRCLGMGGILANFGAVGAGMASEVRTNKFGIGLLKERVGPSSLA